MSKSIINLEKELTNKKKLLKKLEAKKQKLLKELQGVGREISSVTGKGYKTSARRAKPTKPRTKKRSSSQVLSNVLAKVMKGKGGLKVTDVAKLAIKAGYNTKSKQFGNIVSHTLKKDKRFTRVRRGLYKLK